METPCGSRETRESILDATDRLLASRGFRGLTMEDIAREAGVSRRTVYMYFPTKVEVGLSSIERVVSNTQRYLRELAEGAGDPRVVLRNMLLGRVLFRVDSVRDYRQSLNELFEAVRPAYMAQRRRQHTEEAKIFAEVLEQGRQSGRFELSDAESMATILIQATNAFLPYSLSVEELGDREQIEFGLRRMVDLLIRGLCRGENP